jgi:hypothetical protein
VVRGRTLHRDPSAAPVGARRSRARRLGAWSDVLGVLFTVAGAALVMARALRPGITLGPFDLLTRYGLTAQPGVTVHNVNLGDQIQQFVPWTQLAWQQVHSGHLPLWNPDNVLGMPLAFNWQSGVFSLPMLVAYLFPVSYAYTAIVLTKLVVAGSGAYVLCRVLGLGPLSAAFGGTVFELSGPMIVHGGWPHTSVTCWAGWILAAVVLIFRGRRRRGPIVMLVVAIAAAVYGGHPESIVVLGAAVLVFVVVYLAVRARSGAGGAVTRPLVDLAAAGVGGFGLSAPLLLPGVQLGLNSARQLGTGQPAYSLSHLPNVIVAGLQGTDFKTTAYVGVITLVLAVVATRMHWSRPEVPALAAVAVFTALLTFVGPFDRLLRVVPDGGTITWTRAVMPMALAFAVLGALGLQTLLGAGRDRTVMRWTAVGFAACGIALVVLVLALHFGASREAANHDSSLIWPAVQVAVGLAMVALVWWWRRPSVHAHSSARSPSSFAAAVLLVTQAGFLVTAGFGFWSVSSTYFAPNPLVTALQRQVGDALVGYGSCRPLAYLTPSPHEVGIRPNANIGYGIREFVVYDPIISQHYFRSWYDVTGQHVPVSLASLGVFCPRITTAAQARTYGVQYVLNPRYATRPTGAIFVNHVGTENLYQIPDSSPAVALPLGPPGSRIPWDEPGAAVAVTHPDPATWRMVNTASVPYVLRLHLSAVPGWQATIDGRPLPLETWSDQTMLEARIPPGHHVIEVHYWPSLFTVGLVVGAVSVVALVAVVAIPLPRRRHHTGRAPHAGGHEAGEASA